MDATLILLQAGKAIRRAHEAGLVHRDLKPANLFLVRVEGEQDEVVKILDFGIVKETGAVLTEEVTRTGELLGSPHYMSPEQVRGEKDIDQRSDLWSLGVILFYGVTGELPFQGAQLGAVIANILVGPVPSVSLIAPDLPPAIDAFFARALARERAGRFQSIGEMMGELRRIAGMASPSIPDLQSPCSGVPSTARPTLSGTIALDAAKLDEPASAPRSASPGTLTIAGSTAQEAGQQRPQRAMLVVGIAMTMLLGAGVTIAVGRGGTSGGGGVGAKVASAGAPASEEVAVSASTQAEPSPGPLESGTPAVPAAEATGSAADGGDRGATGALDVHHGSTAAVERHAQATAHGCPRSFQEAADPADDSAGARPRTDSGGALLARRPLVGAFHEKIEQGGGETGRFMGFSSPSPRLPCEFSRKKIEGSLQLTDKTRVSARRFAAGDGASTAQDPWRRPLRTSSSTWHRLQPLRTRPFRPIHLQNLSPRRWWRCQQCRSFRSFRSCRSGRCCPSWRLRRRRRAARQSRRSPPRPRLRRHPRRRRSRSRPGAADVLITPGALARTTRAAAAGSLGAVGLRIGATGLVETEEREDGVGLVRHGVRAVSS